LFLALPSRFLPFGFTTISLYALVFLRVCVFGKGYKLLEIFSPGSFYFPLLWTKYSLQRTMSRKTIHFIFFSYCDLTNSVSIFIGEIV
jgi:hypothetical protein